MRNLVGGLFLAISTLILCGSGAGCSRKMYTGSTADTKAVAPKEPQPSRVLFASFAEVNLFADLLARAVRHDDKPAIEGAIDFGALTTRSIGDLDTSLVDRESIDQQSRAALAAGETPFGAAVAAVKAGGEFGLVRVFAVQKTRHALFRIIRPDAPRFDYLDLTITDLGQDRVRVVDFCLASSGEPETQRIRYAQFAKILAKDPTLVQRLPEVEKALAIHLQTCTEMKAAIRDHAFAAAQKAYATLPESVRCQKSILNWRYYLEEAAGEAALLDFVENSREVYRDDPCFAVRLANRAAAQGEPEPLIHAVARLDDCLAGDPYLQWMQAEHSLANGNLAAARSFAARAVYVDPTFANGYRTLVAVSLKEHHDRETVELLGLFADRVHETWDVQRDPAFTEFLRSPEAKAWLVARRGASEGLSEH